LVFAPARIPVAECGGRGFLLRKDGLVRSELVRRFAMRTKQLFGTLFGVMLSLLLVTAVFKPSMAEGDEDTIAEMKLFQAAREGDTETVKALIESGADVSTKDKDGRTALTRAKEKGHKEVVKILKKSGAKE